MAGRERQNVRRRSGPIGQRFQPLPDGGLFLTLIFILNIAYNF